MSDTNDFRVCPICGTILTHWKYETLEEEFKCPKGHYLSEYNYGFTHIFVGDEQWDFDYTTPLEEVNKLLHEVQGEIKRLKEGMAQ